MNMFELLNIYTIISVKTVMSQKHRGEEKVYQSISLLTMSAYTINATDKNKWSSMILSGVLKFITTMKKQHFRRN